MQVEHNGGKNGQLEHDIFQSIGLNEFIESLQKYFLGTVELENDILYKIKKRFFEKEMLPGILNTIGEVIRENNNLEEIKNALKLLIEFFEEHYKDHLKMKTVPLSPYQIKRFELIKYAKSKDTELVFPTKDLYYWKTENGLINTSYDIDNYKFYFEVQSNTYEGYSKKNIVFSLKNATQDGHYFYIVLGVSQKYAQTTDIQQLVKEIEENYQIKVDVKIMKQAINRYQRKIKKIDYFIMKDAKKSLMEEFECFLFSKMMRRDDT